MKIEGTYHVEADPKRVWEGLMSPEMLARCIPGCQQLEQTGDGAYAVKLKAGIGAVTGTYTGTVRIYDIDEPRSFKMSGEGKRPGASASGTGAHHLHSRERRHAAGRGGRGEGYGNNRPGRAASHRERLPRADGPVLQLGEVRPRVGRLTAGQCSGAGQCLECGVRSGSILASRSQELGIL